MNADVIIGIVVAVGSAATIVVVNIIRGRRRRRQFKQSASLHRDRTWPHM